MFSDAAQSELGPLDMLAELALEARLIELSLYSAAVSDLTPLCGLTALKWLNLASTAVSDGEVAKLQEALPQLTIYRGD